MNRSAFFYLAIIPFLATPPLVAAEEPESQESEVSGQSDEGNAVRENVMTFIYSQLIDLSIVDLSKIEGIPQSFIQQFVESHHNLASYEASLIELSPDLLTTLNNLIIQMVQDPHTNQDIQNLISNGVRFSIKKERGMFDKNEARQLLKNTYTSEYIERINHNVQSFAQLLADLLQAKGLTKEAEHLRELLERVITFENQHIELLRDFSVELCLLSVESALENPEQPVTDEDSDSTDSQEDGIIATPTPEEKQQQEPGASGPSGNLDKARNNIFSLMHAQLNKWLSVNLSKIEDVPQDFVQQYVQLQDELLNCQETLLNQLTHERLRRVNNLILEYERSPRALQANQRSLNLRMQLDMKKHIGTFDKSEAKLACRTIITPEEIERVIQNNLSLTRLLASLLEEQGLTEQAARLRELFERLISFENNRREQVIAFHVEVMVLNVENSQDEAPNPSVHSPNPGIQMLNEIGMPEQEIEDMGVQAIANGLTQLMLNNQQANQQPQTGPSQHTEAAADNNGCPVQ